MTLFRDEGPNWFNIPADRPFLDDLAAGVFAELSPLGPDALSAATLLVPNRRAARALSRSFGKAAGGRAMLLPQIRALGDLDEGEPPFEPGDLALDLAPAIDPRRRRFELARLAAAHGPRLGRTLDAVAALELGDALGGFFDSLEIEEASARADIAGLVDGEFAEHWQISADFLDIAIRAWPERLRDLGLADVTARRVELLGKLAAIWSERPPQGPVIAAGSTGSAPATARLLGVIAGLPRGAVVLPGLDADLAADAWETVGDQHPQGAMRRLLGFAGVTRAHVRPWPVSPQMTGRWRRRVVNEALRPAEATADWRAQIGKLRDELKEEGRDAVEEGLTGLSLLTARAEDEAAAVCAVLLRETLETPGATAALVTPDQGLARRVSARLARWDVAVDTSTGSPLAECPAGILISLVARACADPLDPVTLLAILKHPLVGLADEIGSVEKDGLRGPRARDWETLTGRLEDDGARATAAKLKAALDLAAEPYGDGATDPALAAIALTRSVEALAADLWAGPGGDAASSLVGGLIENGAALPAVTPRGFAALIERLLAGETVRMAAAAHPRLQILGALEARLVSADRLILAGLEEGVWPPNAATDPFLSRPMRERLGLPSPERRIGLSAHDFAQAACADEVYLVHTERRGGQPSIRSRWLWRLETLAEGAGVPLGVRPEIRTYAALLDAPGLHLPARRPAPRPPVADRPDKMAVTRVETLTRDPYAVWARDILRLYPVPPPDEMVDVRGRGTAIHEAFERFAKDWPSDLPPDAAERFKALYLEELVKAGIPRTALAREEALGAEAAAWVAHWETHRRAGGGVEIVVERKGKLVLNDLPGGPFTLTAKTDRIELTPDGLAHILDYKTGAAPTPKTVKTGFSPQLTLTAAILAHGEFEGIGRRTPGQLAYVEITGRKPAGKEVVLFEADASLEEADRTLEGLRELVKLYRNPDMAYISRTAPQFVKTYASDYDHLARVFEWSSGDDDGGEA